MEKRHQLSLAPQVFILPTGILLFSSLSKPVWQSLLNRGGQFCSETMECFSERSASKGDNLGSQQGC